MKKIIKPLWLALATLSALLTVVSCVKELAVKEQEVNFESSLTTELSQIVRGDSIVSSQLLINEEEVDCPRPTKYSVSFTYDEEAGTLFFLGDSIQSGTSIPLASLTNLSLTYQAKKLVGNKVDVTVSNDAPKKLSKELVWNILADKTYWVKSEQEGEGEITITGADDLDAVEPDTKLAVTAKPADGWELVTLTANEEDIREDKSFEVTENTIVRATFKELTPETYAVTLTKEGEGKVAISGADNLGAVVTGSKLTVTATPADGWELASLTANGGDILSSKTFVVYNPTEVKAVFTKKAPTTYAVTLTQEGEGKVAITGADDLNRVPAGTKLTVTATPAKKWKLTGLTANGADILSSKSFVVYSPTEIKATFVKEIIDVAVVWDLDGLRVPLIGDKVFNFGFTEHSRMVGDLISAKAGTPVFFNFGLSFAEDVRDTVHITLNGQKIPVTRDAKNTTLRDKNYDGSFLMPEKDGKLVIKVSSIKY